MSAPFSLPVEICDLVLSNLSMPNNAKTLRSACLVCRTWRRLGQRELFAELQVDGRPRSHQLTQILDASPHLAPFVRKAILKDGSKVESPDLNPEPRNFWLRWCSTLRRLLSKCVNIDILELRHVFIDENIFDLCNSVPNVRILNLVVGTNTSTGNELFCFVRGFLRLQELQLDGDFGGHLGGGRAQEPFALRLSKLTTRSTDRLPWIVFSNNTGWRLEVDEIEYTLTYQVLFVCPFDLFRHVSGELKRLYIQFAWKHLCGMFCSSVWKGS
jgi:hypothetical protein